MVMPERAPAPSGTNNQPRSVTPPSTVNPTSCRCTITPPPTNAQNAQTAQPNVAGRPAGASGRHTERRHRVGIGGAALAVIVNPPVRHGVWFFSFDRMLL